MDKASGDESKLDNRPSPTDFDQYLPWACKQLQLGSTVQVIRVYQNEYVSAAITDRSKKGKSKGRLAPCRLDSNTEQEKKDKISELTSRHKVIKVIAIYDFLDNLVEIKLEKNSQLPRVMIKVIGLIVQFQPHLNTVTINGGLDHYTLYEICKFLPTVHITELCLDGCFLNAPNYHMLLENANFLKYVSLCRCKIDDSTLEILCSKLIYPLPASHTLTVLNLSSNTITDEGAKCLAGVLRCNRQLSYLNVASNLITDKGAAAIFDTLKIFPLTREEILTSKARYLKYLKTKNDMMLSTIRGLRLGDLDKKTGKKKSIRPLSTGIKKASQKSIVDPIKCLTDVDSGLVEKATSIVKTALGDFADPYNNTNTTVKNDITYCKGNNSLCCLNISYNYLSYLSLRKVQSVLLYQRHEDRIPRGLLSVSVEGNCVPITCRELSQIDDILEINLVAQTRKLSTNKKRPHSKAIR